MYSDEYLIQLRISRHKKHIEHYEEILRNRIELLPSTAKACE